MSSLINNLKLAKAASFPPKQKINVACGALEYVSSELSGSENPVIVLLSGGGAVLESWGAVYPQFAAMATVLAYNRFGVGGSDLASGKQTGEVIASALHDLLAEAGLQPPYLLVGHSLGGFHANIFARLYPQEIAGVVFLEASHPDDFETLSLHQTLLSRIFEKVFTALYFIFRKSQHSEMDCTKEVVAQMKRVGAFPEVPISVITAGKAPLRLLMSSKALQIRLDNQKKFLQLSNCNNHVIAGQSGHFVQLSEPELVVNVVREILTRIKGESGLER